MSQDVRYASCNPFTDGQRFQPSQDVCVRINVDPEMFMIEQQMDQITKHATTHVTTDCNNHGANLKQITLNINIIEIVNNS